MAAQSFATSEPIYGRVWVDGVTNGAGHGAGVHAEVGFAPDGQPIDSTVGWIWYGAHYNVDVDGIAAGDLANDEYVGAVFPYKPGTMPSLIDSRSMPAARGPRAVVTR